MVLRYALTSVIALTLVFAGQGVAAAGDGHITVPDGTLYGTCQQYPYAYSFDVQPGYDYYLSGSMSVTAADGTTVATDPIAEFSSQGSNTFRRCGGLPGRYSVNADINACNSDLDCYALDVDPSAFTLRRPSTRTRLIADRATATNGQVVRLTVNAFEQRPRGWAKLRQGHVLLQQRVNASWVRLAGTQVTINATHTWRIRMRGNSAKFRAVTRSAAEYRGSTSRPFVFNPGR
jgi:hypothetical protein